MTTIRSAITIKPVYLVCPTARIGLFLLKGEDLERNPLCCSYICTLTATYY